MLTIVEEAYASGPLVVGLVLGPDEPVPAAMDALDDQVRLEVVRGADPQELLRRCSDAEVLFVWEFRRNWLAEALPGMSHLRWIQTASAGVDAVVSPRLADSGVILTNTRGVLDATIAEWVLGVMLVFVKDLHGTLALQRTRTWQHRESERLAGKRVLVVGAGSVGRAIARLARAAGMEVDGIASEARPGDADFGRVDGTEALLDRLPLADFVVVSAPLTAGTRGLIGAEALASMGPGCRLVNVGRGPVVDEEALLAALESGHLAGAALDVFVQEPLPRDHRFWDMDNVIVSPHQSGDFQGWRESFGQFFLDNLARYRRGEELVNVVDVPALLTQMSST